MKPVYLDYNATTPVDPEVVDAMLPFLKEHFGNPSSLHIYGQKAKEAVEKAREQVSKLINCKPSEIIFTSGGTESNNFAIKGSSAYFKSSGNHIITSEIEHPAVIEVCKYLNQQGFEITYLPVDQYGTIRLKDLEKAIRPTTILLTIMHANNEIGTIQPIQEIAELAQKKNIRFHTDAAQSIGKIPVDVEQTGVDMLSIAGHKFYAPKGIGALYIKKGTPIEKFMHGAGHEQNRRAGTENVSQIVGLGKAAEIALRDFEKNTHHMQKLRDLLWQLLINKLPECKLNGHPRERLPNTLNVSFPGLKANTLLTEMQEVAASAGAACHSEGVTLSSVLQAIKLAENTAMGTIRFSTGKYLTLSEITKAAEIIIKSVERLKIK